MREAVRNRQRRTLSAAAVIAKTLFLFLVDKVTIGNDGDDENDVYETIEFSDSSTHVYTEPVRDYGVLRRVNIKTSPKQQQKKTTGLKKSAGSRNLQKFSAMQDVSAAGKDDDEAETEENVQLRTKPPIPAARQAITKPTTSLISVGLRNNRT